MTKTPAGRDAVIVTLAGKPHTISPLTLGDLRRLHLGMAAVDDRHAEKGKSKRDLTELGFDRMVAAVVCALLPHNPDLSEDALLGMDISVAELSAAYTAVLKLAGLEDAGE